MYTLIMYLFGFKMKLDSDKEIQPLKYGQKKGQDQELFNSSNLSMRTCSVRCVLTQGKQKRLFYQPVIVKE